MPYRAMASRVAPWLLLTALAATYVAGAWVTGAAKWDGLAPQPYRYVSPPAGITNGGQPGDGNTVVHMSSSGSVADQVATTDLQAQFIMPAGLFPASATSKDVTVTIKAEAPAPSVVGGVELIGNVYLVQAVDSGGKSLPDPWSGQADFYLLYPDSSQPNGLYMLESGQPKLVEGSQVDLPTLQIVAKINRGGRYVAGGKPGSGPKPGGVGSTTGSGGAGPSLTTIFAAVATLGFVLVIAGVGLALRRGNRNAAGR